MRAPIATPNALSANASTKIRGMSSSTLTTVSFTPTTGAKISRMTPWMRACVAPPRVLPMATAARLMGATKTSLRKPNSRSQTMDMALKIELNSTDMPMIPGKMNCW